MIHRRSATLENEDIQHILLIRTPALYKRWGFALTLAVVIPAIPITVTHNARVRFMTLTRRKAIALFPTSMVAASGFSQSGAAQTRDPPREIQTLIDNHINGFNTQNTELFLGVFGDTAIIIDGIAPYRWLNPNAPANWLADVEKWRKDLGVSHEHLSYEMGFWNVEGSDAYAVIAGTLTVTIKGQTVARTGTLAYTFSKHGEGWKIDAQAWGRTS